MACIHNIRIREEALLLTLSGGSLGMEELHPLRKELFPLLKKAKVTRVYLDTRSLDTVGSLVISLLVDLLKLSRESTMGIIMVEDRRQGLESLDLSAMNKLIEVARKPPPDFD